MTVELLIGQIASETTDTITVSIGTQAVVALKPTATRPILLRVGDQVVSL